MNTKRGTLIVVAGPTGSGKSALAVRLAQYYNAPIISTDSRQVFRGLAIGTAQPTAEELAAYASLRSNYPNTSVLNDGGAGMTVAYVADTKLYIDKKLSV
jgi:cytidylate kinase